MKTNHVSIITLMLHPDDNAPQRDTDFTPSSSTIVQELLNCVPHCAAQIASDDSNLNIPWTILITNVHVINFLPTPPTHSFSSNFIAGRKGNALSLRAWDSIKAALKQKCHHTDGDDNQGVCCYTATGEPRQCHIPWAAIGEGTSHPIAASLVKSGTLRVHCYDVDHGFVPSIVQSNEISDKFRLGSGNLQWVKVKKCVEGACPCARSGTDLRCGWTLDDGHRVTANITNYFSRMAYHLFASTLTAAEKSLTQSELLEGSWAVSDLFRRAMQGRSSADSNPSAASPKKGKVGVRDPFKRVDTGVIEEDGFGDHAPRPRRTKKGIKRPSDFGGLGDQPSSWEVLVVLLPLGTLWIGRRLLRRLLCSRSQ